MTKRTLTFNKRTALAAIALLAISCAIPASAQSDWPSRPIKLVVPFGAGGGTDVLGRLLAQKLTESLGQPVMVDNRAGAGGSVGTAEVSRAPADGYTIMLGTNSTHAINPGIYAKLPYNAIKDFSPVSLIATNRFVMVVPASLPVKNLGELISLAKANPGKYDYASSGNGTTSHLAASLFVSMSGAQLTHIPYKSNGPALNDLLAGRVAVMFDNITALQSHIESGALRAIATTGLTRSPVLKDVPTLDEAGVKDYAINGWFGVFAPTGTPVEAVNRLNRELVRIVALPEIRERLNAIGADAQTSTPAQFRQLIATELPKWAGIIQTAGARID